MVRLRIMDANPMDGQGFPQAAAASDPEYRRDYQITAGNVTRALIRYPILSTGQRTCQGKSRKIGATGKIAMGLGIRTDTLLVVSRPRGVGRARNRKRCLPTTLVPKCLGTPFPKLCFGGITILRCGSFRPP